MQIVLLSSLHAIEIDSSLLRIVILLLPLKLRHFLAQENFLSHKWPLLAVYVFMMPPDASLSLVNHLIQSSFFILFAIILFQEVDDIAATLSLLLYLSHGKS